MLTASATSANNLIQDYHHHQHHSNHHHHHHQHHDHYEVIGSQQNNADSASMLPLITPMSYYDCDNSSSSACSSPKQQQATNLIHSPSPNQSIITTTTTTTPSSCSSPSTCSTPKTTTATNQFTYSPTNAQQLANAAKRLCAVCSDMASGYHYGVWSCEGCKAFFKRSTQGEEPLYVCPATNTCTIDKQRRKSCQSCRLKKCFSVGMTKGNMRRERKQYNKRERKSNTEAGKSTAKTHKQQQQQQQPLANAINSQKDLLNTLVINETQIEMKFENELEQMGLVKRTIQILNGMVGTNQQQECNQLQLKQLIIDHVGKECLLLILWAKTIQNYQTLNLNDQAHLIETNFMEILILNYIWRTCMLNNSGMPNDSCIYFNKTFKLNRQTCKDLNITCIFDSIMQIVRNFVQLRVTIKEYACLKMLVLLKSDYGCMDSQSLVDLREKSINTLDTAIDTSNDSMSTACNYRTHRMSCLLLLIAEIKSLSLRFIHYILYIHSIHQIELPDLLIDMFDAQRVLGLVASDFNRHDSIDSAVSSSSSSASTIGQTMAMTGNSDPKDPLIDNMDIYDKTTTKTEYDQHDDHMIYQDFLITSSERHHTTTTTTTNCSSTSTMDYAHIEPFNLNKLN